MLEDAKAAIAETEKALKALEDKKKDEAGQPLSPRHGEARADSRARPKAGFGADRRLDSDLRRAGEPGHDQGCDGGGERAAKGWGGPAGP